LLEQFHVYRKFIGKPAANDEFNVELQGTGAECVSSLPAQDSADEELSLTSAAEDRKSRLLRTGITVATSIALHNFPEGVATFLAAVANWRVGVATAFAIAMHNIPEGISISVPYYYASESRWKAFALASLSGVAEPIGAIVGWGMLGSIWGHTVFGVMFGITAGVMVYISLIEILPLARKHDPEEKITATMIIVGMIVMDVSLLVAVGNHSH